MNARRISALTTLALAAAALPAAAQQSQQPVPPVFDVTPYVGYMMFGKYLEGPIGTSISNANSPIYGAQLGLAIAPNLSLVGNLGYASSDLKIGVPFLGGLSVGSTNVLLYDGGLRYTIPLASNGTRSSTIAPFVQAGAGAMHYDVKTGIFKTTATNFAFNFGGGLEYQVSPSLGIDLAAKDYVGKFNFKNATNINFEGRTAHNVALSVGLRLGF